MPRWRGPSSIGGGSSDVATDPDPGDATSPTLRHFQELKSAPPRASGFAYACSATKALAGDGAIAVPQLPLRTSGGSATPPDRMNAVHRQDVGRREDPRRRPLSTVAIAMRETERPRRVAE